MIDHKIFNYSQKTMDTIYSILPVRHKYNSLFWSTNFKHC